MSFLEVNNIKCDYYQDHQVLVVKHAIRGKDSLGLHLIYAGEIDERISQLDLPDDQYEDSFHGDSFFPTGRRTAFVEKNILLLTPVCIWYPVTIPPENPIKPVCSRRDFTRFELTVVSPCQKVIRSQGISSRDRDAWCFKTSHRLRGISLCGSDYAARRFELQGMNLHLFSWGGFDLLFQGFSSMKSDLLKKSIEKYSFFEREKFEKFPYMSWYEEKSKEIMFFETPVSFFIENRVGDVKRGQVEPGMIFFPERGFGFNMIHLLRGSASRDLEEKKNAAKKICDMVLRGGSNCYNSHPLLGLGRVSEVKEGKGLCTPSFLWKEARTWIHSDKYPFIGMILDKLKSSGRDGLKVDLNFVYINNPTRDYLIGRSLQDILFDKSLDRSLLESILFFKIKDLWDRLTLDVPFEKWMTVLTNFDVEHEGEVDYKYFVSVIKDSLNVDLDKILLDWINTRHEQFYRVRDLKVVIRKSFAGKDYKLSGKIMNVGKSGGVVFVEGDDMLRNRRYSYFLEPGEARSFEIVADVPPTGINTGLSSNRPSNFRFESITWESGDRVVEYYCQWQKIDTSLFAIDSNEIVIDDQDRDFELVNGDRVWLYRWIANLPESRFVGSHEAPRWTPSIDYQFYGDSIRGCYFKSGGDGKFKAIWNTMLPKEGKYRVMAKISRLDRLANDNRIPLEGVIYYYTVDRDNWQEEIEINFDGIDFSREPSKWVSLGEFEFPKGKARVVLSDREVRQRKEVPIIADAVKWIKIE